MTVRADPKTLMGAGGDPGPLPASLAGRDPATVDMAAVEEAKARPEGHSATGASSAKRWLHCAGSVALTAKLPGRDTEFNVLGTAAHALASDCLRSWPSLKFIRPGGPSEGGTVPWEHLGETYAVGDTEIAVDADMVDSVQVYLDAIAADIAAYQAEGHDDAIMLVEHQFWRPEIDANFFGTTDCAVFFPAWCKLNVYDYKHGVGVYVDVRENDQCQYYAAGVVPEFDGWAIENVECVIVQPRHDTAEGLVRRWGTTFDGLGEWLAATLLPGLARTRDPNATLVAGGWCQFCSAKMAGVCPVLNATFDAAAAEWPADAADVPTLENWELADRLSRIEQLRFVIKALEAEGFTRLNKGTPVPGWKLVPKKADRVWKDGAGDVALLAVGDGAFTTPELRSPAQIEKLPGGKELVAEFAFKPDTGLTLASEGDRRTGVTVRPATDRFADIK